MPSVSEEIQQLKLRIIELEKQQKELNEIKTNIVNDRYSKSVPLARYYDQEVVRHLHATYIFHTM